MESIYKYGCEELITRRKTAFLCSRQVPNGVPEAVESWLESLHPDRDCVMCGNQSSLEHTVFTGLLNRKIPTILVLAQAMPEAFSAQLQTAVTENRLLVITHCDASVHWATAQSARDRNILMISMAAEVVVGFCSQGGNLSRQLMNANNVRYLFQHEMTYTPLPEDSGGKVNEAQPEVLYNAAKTWKRRMWSVNKAVTVELDSSGVEPLFRIWQVLNIYDEGDQSSKIVLGIGEMIDFHEALGDVIIQLGDRNLTDMRATVVKSVNGNITFDFEKLTDDGVLVVIQSYETRFIGKRRRSIRLNAREIRTFYEKVSEAAQKAVEVIKGL